MPPCQAHLHTHTHTVGCQLLRSCLYKPASLHDVAAALLLPPFTFLFAAAQRQRHQPVSLLPSTFFSPALSRLGLRHLALFLAEPQAIPAAPPSAHLDCHLNMI